MPAMFQQQYLHLFLFFCFSLFCLQAPAQQTTAEQQADSLLDYAQKNYEQNIAGALDAARKALNLAQEKGMPLYICKSHNQLGSIYTNVTFFPKAMEEFHKGLTVAKQNALPDQQAELLCAIGNVHFYEDSLHLALEHYQQAFALSQETKNLQLLGRTMGNIGLVHSRMGQRDNAEEYIRQALQLNRQLNNHKGLCINYSNLGSMFLGRQQFDSARYYYELTLKIALQLGDVREIAYAHLGNAQLERRLKNTAAAKQHLLEALHISNNTSLTYERKRSLASLSQLEEEAGNHKKALAYSRQYIRISDSLQQMVQRTDQQQLQQLLEAERNSSENRILKADVAAREHALKASLANQERQLAITLASIAAFVFLAGIMAFFVYHYRQNSKNHRQLQQMHVAIKSQARELEQAYDKIHQHNLALEGNIAERTRQLNQQNRQLIQYAFFNAHKVRGPLARIMGLVNLLPKAEHDTEFRFILQRLDESALELDKVVHEINLILEGKPEHQDN
jgi:tetratricopeptide (TPR) repeat protein